MLGLVTSKTGALESVDELERRIAEAAKFVDPDQLCLSPQCGFASTEEGNALTEDEQWAKLARIVEVAWRESVGSLNAVIEDRRAAGSRPLDTLPEAADRTRCARYVIFDGFDIQILGFADSFC